MNKLDTVNKDELVLGPYKEPLRKVEVGYGYFGAISLSKDGKSIQCHICGELRENLSGHLRQHKITVGEYRAKFGLSAGTALISEATRQKYKEHMFAIREGWGPERLAKQLAAFHEGSRLRRNRGRNQTPEYKNIHGTCPDQLIQLIHDAYTHYTRPCSYAEFERFHQTGRFYGPIRATFGTWAKAVKSAGLETKGKSGNGGGAARYSDEELLEFLSNYHLETGKIPSSTDCKRGFIPTYNLYRKRFGSMEEARRRSGINDYILKIGGSHTPQGVIKV